MSVKSIFNFRFADSSREEGLRLVLDVGNDMMPFEGYLDHEIIQDFSDSGHLMISTRWETREHAEGVLKKYKNNHKIRRISQLLPDRAAGFIGAIITPASHL